MKKPAFRVLAVIALVAVGLGLPACTSTGGVPVNVGVSVNYGYGYGAGWGRGWSGGYRPPYYPIGPPIYSTPRPMPMPSDGG